MDEPPPAGKLEESKPEQEQSGDKKGGGQPAAVPIIPPESDGPKKQKTAQERTECREKWKLGLEVVGVGAAIIYAWFTIQEWRVFDSERKTMEREFQLTQTSVELEQRAWVLVTNVCSQPIKSPPNCVCFKVAFKNTGKTPAINTTGWAKFTEKITDVPMTFTFPDHPLDSTMLAPDEGGYVLSPQFFQAGLQQVTNGFIKLYVFGAVRYDDIFHKHHWSRFCYQLSSEAQAFTGVPGYNTCDDAESNGNPSK
jgi:hypothetical protein